MANTWIADRLAGLDINSSRGDLGTARSTDIAGNAQAELHDSDTETPLNFQAPRISRSMSPDVFTRISVLERENRALQIKS